MEKLDAALVRPHAGTAVRAIEVLATTPSTNEELLSRARAGTSIDRVALLAEQQTAGRGRRGRPWQSPGGGNLYLSLGWRCETGIRDGFSLVVGIALVRALRAACGVAAQLKWPNDLQVDERKLGGILVEIAGDFGGPLDAVIGIGLNIALPATAAAAIEQPWIDLASLCAAPPERNRLAGTLLVQLVTALDQLQDEGFAAFRAEWNALDALHAREVVVSGSTQALRGTAHGVDETGALLVREGGMLHRVAAGDVSLRAIR